MRSFLTSSLVRRLLVAGLLLIASFVVPSAHAIDATWNGTTNGNYNVGTNWSGNAVPAPAGTATFNNGGNGNTTLTNTTTTINVIKFDTANAAAYTLGSAADTITLDSNFAGGLINMTSSVINGQVINSNLILGNITGGTPGSSGTYNFTNSTATNSPTLTIGGNISGYAGGTAGNEILQFNGPGAGFVTGNISNGGALSLGLTLNGGIWTVSGNNGFTGASITVDGATYAKGIDVGAGTLIIGSNSAVGNGVLRTTSTSSVIQAGGAPRAISNTFLIGNGTTISGSNDLTFNGVTTSSGASFTLNNNNTGLTTFAGDVHARDGAASGTARTLTFAGSGATVISGAVLNGAAGAAGNVAYAGSGSLTLSGADTYTGTTVVSSGLLNLDYTSNAATKISGTGTGGALTLGGGTLTLVGGATTETVANTNLAIGASAINRPSGTSTVNLKALTRNSGSTLALGAGGIALTSTGTANTLLTSTTGVIGVVGGNDWAAKDAANSGIVGYSTVNTYNNSTATTVSSGNQTDVVGNVTFAGGAAASTSTLRFNTPGAATIDASGAGNPATLSLTQSGILVTSAVGANTSTITGGFLKPGGNNALIIFQNNTAGGLTIDSTITNNGATAAYLAKSGAGLLTLSNPLNTYTGKTYLNQGITNIAADASLGTAPAAAVADQLTFNGGTLQAGANNITLNANRGVTLLTSGGAIDTNGTTGSAVAGIVTGTGVLTKTGSGALNLTNANTYSGGTSVTGGTLNVSNASGSGTGTGNVVVGNGAGLNGTLGGNGTISVGANTVTVNNGSSISPGFSPGILSIAGTQTVAAVGASTLNLASGSTYVLELGGTVAGMSYDQINLTGTASIAGSNLSINIINGFTPTVGSMFTIVNNDAAEAILGTFAQGATVTANNGQQFTVAYAGGDGNDIVLTTLTAVPEPSTWATMIGGVLLLIGLQRFRHRKSH